MNAAVSMPRLGAMKLDSQAEKPAACVGAGICLHELAA
jgi:hypothetical protein